MLSLLFLLAVCSPQDPATPAPLPDGVVARVGDREIQQADYLQFLYQRLGKRPLEDYIADLLVEQEARAYGLELAPAHLEELLAEREQQDRQAAGDTGFLERLRNEGKDLAMYRAVLGAELRRDYLTGELVRATRVVTDERLQQEFERAYGPGGTKLRVRHVLVMPNVLRAERLRAGAKPTEIDLDALKVEARELAGRARARIAGGEPFAAVAAELSHDRVTKEQGGELQDYNGRLYGPSFLAAVEALPPGELSEVLETGAGFHVVELLDRSTTRLEDVRAELSRLILEAEPNWQERSALIQALRARAQVQLW